LDPAIRHTIVHHSSTSTYIPNFIQIEETFCGRTDGRTDVRTDIFPPLVLLGRLLEVDLKMIIWYRSGYNQTASDAWRYNNPVYKLMTDKLQLMLINVLFDHFFNTKVS